MKKKKQLHSPQKTPDALSIIQSDLAANAYHTPVLLKETIDGLCIKPNGIYVDCTFGGGGHSREILKRLGELGKLIAFDQDADALQNVPEAEKRVVFVQQNFRYLKQFIRLNGIEKVDGILADLGVSSHQFNEAARGFSIRFDADLDMRMNKENPVTAFTVISTYNETRLHKVFEQYGEVSNAKTLASKIVTVRGSVSLKTIEGFKNALREVVKGNPNKYFAKVFQALRMEVNEEMAALKEMLEQSVQLLKPSARIAVITFHSIEDRMVKHFFKTGNFDEKEENPFENTYTEKVFKIITKKPITASDAELELNPRSRSAKLRIAERIV